MALLPSGAYQLTRHGHGVLVEAGAGAGSGYVDAEYYWSVKLPLFRAQEAAWKRGGRSKYWASRVVNTLGTLYTGLVLEAWGTNRIPFHQAADYFGLKNPSHLNSIKQEFGGA